MMCTNGNSTLPSVICGGEINRDVTHQNDWFEHCTEVENRTLKATLSLGTISQVTSSTEAGQSLVLCALFSPIDSCVDEVVLDEKNINSVGLQTWRKSQETQLLGAMRAVLSTAKVTTVNLFYNFAILFEEGAGLAPRCSIGHFDFQERGHTNPVVETVQWRSWQI